MLLFNLLLNPGQAQVITCLGKYISVKTATLPFTIGISGGDQREARSGQVIPAEKEFQFINVVNPNLIQIEISMWIGDLPVQYAPADSSSKPASTYFFGNLGANSGAGASGGRPACNATGFLQVRNSQNYFVSGNNNGHRRQTIIFTMAVGAASLNVMDVNLRAFMTIGDGAIISLPTDADFYISGTVDGLIGSLVTIGEIYLEN